MGEVGLNESSQPNAADSYLGLVIEDVFRLDELIGLGTTGRVYRATQMGFSRPVAVKVIHRHLMQTPDVRNRFHREARLASRLTHGGIVQVLASGELPTIDADVGGEAYLVSEYLEGISWRALLDHHEKFQLGEALSLMIAVSDAVGEAHAQHIVHRDLKPENIMRASGPEGGERHVVLDFGLARALDHEQDPLTHDGAILGTPQYMSPEAARGQSTTPASDVYSLATILYELLAGQPPFHADSPMLVLLAQVESEPPPLGVGVPRPIDEVLKRELSKLSEQRSSDARRFAIDLFVAARHSGIPAGNLLLPQLSEDFLEQLPEARAESWG